MSGKGKGKGKEAAGGGKGKGGGGGGEKGGDLKTCNHVKGRHILCEKMGKAQEAYKVMKNNTSTTKLIRSSSMNLD